MPTSTQTPMEELQERIAEIGPSKILPSLIAIQNKFKDDSLYRKMVANDYKAGMKLLGHEVDLKEEEDDMSNFMVTGDITINKPSKSTPEPPPISVPKPAFEPTPEPSPSLTSKLLPIIGYALIGSGLTAVAIATYLGLSQPNTELPPDTNTQYQLKTGIGTPVWEDEE